MYFLVKGGMIGCLRMAGNYAPTAFDEINDAVSEKPMGVPSAPASCTALLAKKMGASEMQAAMAAGLAGGIGLSGGACGALGAAIWLISIKSIEGGDGSLDFTSPIAAEVVDRFVECTDYEFECAEIVGRKFENTADHAAHLQEGGCSKILEVLANGTSETPRE